ncbi:hypothetical protein FA95DRAFT_907197 [Auriscalpium vulgare]|uniref:Uncharacterized protein n=1 Tax=Auriscalpium vulgare TaxID=40419 RepID=A0ACB8RZ26_9AGAM|nr:hypothetical protein FA95DRAFT_907197 [Auriscalpium vulgare]
MEGPSLSRRSLNRLSTFVRQSVYLSDPQPSTSSLASDQPPRRRSYSFNLTSSPFKNLSPMALFSTKALARGRKPGRDSPAPDVSRPPNLSIIQEAPLQDATKYGGVGLLRRAGRRRSTHSVFAYQSESSPASPSTSTFSRPSPVSSASSLPLSDEDEKKKATLLERKKFRWQEGVRFHPFDMDEAPYMQAYDQMALENDRYSHALMQKLTPRGSPSFHDYLDKPPSRVLDLGCGQGDWVVEAATCWKKAKVYGLDLVDLASGAWDLDRSVADNITWVRHNYVAHALPFPSESFDFIRLSNSNLCIPFERYGFVLAETRRVLRVGGRLEVVDDQLYFPYIAPSSPVKATFTSRSRQASSGYDSDSDNSDGEQTIRPGTRKLGSARESAKSPYEEWENEMKNCQDLESIFSGMLQRKYGMNLRPAEYLPSMMRSGYGPENVSDARTIHVCLPSREFMNGVEGDMRKNPDMERGWSVTIDWERKEKKDEKGKAVEASLAPMQPTELPATLSKKAAAMLGAARLSPAGVPYQQPGLVIFPSTFIPMSPAEVEMHSSKNLHTLLSCRAAIRDFTSEHTAIGGPSPEELENALWEYEIFRRRRFNWPADLPELRLSEQFAQEPSRARLSDPTASPSKLKRTPSQAKRYSGSSYTILNPPETLEGLTFVRSLRIFEAIKTSRVL